MGSYYFVTPELVIQLPGVRVSPYELRKKKS